MLISREWLSEYVDLSGLSDEELSQTLTQLGLEVEEVKPMAAMPDGLVIAEIETAEKHPQADQLKICRVKISATDVLDIVCGAPNARAGIKVVLAQVGCKLTKDITITKSKIRGLESCGMLCSEKELGLSEDHDGIFEVPSSWQLGEPLTKYIKTEDSIFLLNVTPNRSDCFSYIGVARDLAAKLKKSLRKPENFSLSGTASNIRTDDKIKLMPLEQNLSGRFCAGFVTGLKACASPLWMQRRLKVTGIRPINLIVDITNYVMFEQGQPIHAYDYDVLEKKNLGVRLAKKGEMLATLDDQKFQLNEADIVITDGESPVGLAGIMGGASSQIRPTTHSVVIEVAHFDSVALRKTAKRLALHTEASSRFEKGIDLQNIPYVLLRVCELLLRTSQEMGITTVQLPADFLDQGHSKIAAATIALRLERAKRILAMSHLTTQSCVDTLKRLGLNLLDRKDERMVFSIPTYRHDLVREIDLIEEIGRMEGFDRIPYEMPVLTTLPPREDPYLSFQDQLKKTLTMRGLVEAIAFPFCRDADFEKLGIQKDHPLFPSLSLKNALSEEFSYLSTTPLMGLIKATKHNRNRGHKGARLFEIARCFFAHTTSVKQGRHLKASDHSHSKNETKRPVERNILGVVLDHPHQLLDAKGERAQEFSDIKSILEQVFADFSAEAPGLVAMDDEHALAAFLHPRASALICSPQGDVIGFLGELHPLVCKNFDLEGPAPVVMHVDVEFLFEQLSTLRKLDTVDKRFPSTSRDLALLMDRSIPFSSLESWIHKFEKKKNLRHFKLFDVYTGTGIPENKKSLALTFSFLSPEKTLTDGDVDLEFSALTTWLCKSLPAERR